nr:DUF5675 family protein [uncultured Pedobacter sp.]
MELTLTRKSYSKRSTIGLLAINAMLFCATLEDVCRDKNRDGDLADTDETKVHGQTAIPAGRYQVVITYSNRFKKYMPLLLNVPGFAGIRIHSGNRPEDTEGCILVGKTAYEDWISESRITYDQLFQKLQEADKNEKIYITILDTPV